jgi:hypothetical protein
MKKSGRPPLTTKQITEDLDRAACAARATGYRELRAQWAAGEARAGDWESLAQHIESGGLITDDLRALLTQILRGELRRPKGRPQSKETAEEHLNMAIAVAQLQTEGVPTESAVAEIAQKFRADPRTVYRAMKKHNEKIHFIREGD